MGPGRLPALAGNDRADLFCGIVLFELVRSIWGQADPNFSSGLIESIGGLFGG